MDLYNRIQFSEQKEARDTMEHTSLLDVAKEIGLLRLAVAGMIACGAFFGFFWSMSLLWVGLGGVL